MKDTVYMIYEAQVDKANGDRFENGYPYVAVAYATREKALQQLKAMHEDVLSRRRWTDPHFTDGEWDGYFDYQRFDGSICRRWIVGIIVLE